MLPLTEEQKKVIMALNHLVNEGRYQTRLADAAAVTADPTRREQLLPKAGTGNWKPFGTQYDS